MGELQFGYRVASLELTVSAFTYKTNTLVVTVPDPAAPIGQAYVNGIAIRPRASMGNFIGMRARR